MLRYSFKRPGIRLLSTPSVTYNDVSSYNSFSGSVASETDSKNIHGNQTYTKSYSKLASLPSSQSVASLSRTHFTSSVESELQVKHDLYDMLNSKQHLLLLEVIHRLTKQGVWSVYLTSDELGFFIGKLVDHSVEAMVGLARLHTLKKYIPEADLAVQYDESKRYRNQIREIYSHLLFKPKASVLLSIYDKKLRTGLYKADMTGYMLSMTDYENLVVLEYGNNKLDLAQKWFERYYQQGYTNQQMSPKLWEYRFKLAGADPRMWEVFLSDVYKGRTTQVSRSYYKKNHFPQVLNEFLQYNSASDCLASIIYGLAYQQNISGIEKIMSDEYGIHRQVNSDQTSFVRNGDRSPPSLDVIRALIISLSYNKRYFDVMKLINLLQSEFQMDISHSDYKPIWEALIKWGDITTRYSKKLALRNFIKHHNPEVVASAQRFQEVLKDTNFDYERYLQYFEQLKTTRNNVMKQIFYLYHQDQQNASETKFSLKNYITYQSFIKQSRDESEYYKYLTSLAQYYQSSAVSSQSFNQIHLQLNKQAYSIYNLYYGSMISFIKLKVDNQLMGQIKYLIDEWSLNEHMKTQLNEYYSSNMNNFSKVVEAKRKEKMETQRTEETDEDKFLDLI